MLSESDLGKTKQKKPKYLQNPNQMDTKTSVAENKGFHFRSGKHPQKKKTNEKTKRKGEKTKFRDTKTKWNKKTKKKLHSEVNHNCHNCKLVLCRGRLEAKGKQRKQPRNRETKPKKRCREIA
jgi:hypothetical protein